MNIPPQSIVILDFGSQYTQLIARRIRELHIYSAILPYRVSPRAVMELDPAGIILSGGPASVYQENAPHCDPELFRLGIPVLGICYGFQLLAHLLGGQVTGGGKREFGYAELHIHGDSPLFAGLAAKQKVWMSHGDTVTSLPPDYTAIGSTSNTAMAAVAAPVRQYYGLQFHPEVVHTACGKEILSNFCLKICACQANWTMTSFIETTIAAIRERVKDKEVILGLSGGVDSSVAAVLLHRALGRQLISVFVDNGLLRAGEGDAVKEMFGRNLGIAVTYVDASARFLQSLEGIDDPETKRKIIGGEFIAVFEETAQRFPKVAFLGQGTTYPDVIESVSINDNPSAVIKSHHNVGGLPEVMKLALIEPLRQLFKDEVREVGKELGLPHELIWRQPFPGPGLAVRIIGVITAERLEVLRQADKIVIDEMKKADYYYRVWQSFAVLLPVCTVGVMGDERTYENVVALRVVDSADGMTADWTQLPYELLGTIANRIINEVRGVNRVCYDISSKPPSTIEWE